MLHGLVDFLWGVFCEHNCDFLSNFSAEMGQTQAAMFFRSEPNWELAEPLRDLGMTIIIIFLVLFSFN